MSFFRLETFEKDGKVVNLLHIELSGVGDVEQAAKNEKVIKLKKLARDMGCGFRIKREE